MSVATNTKTYPLNQESDSMKYGSRLTALVMREDGLSEYNHNKH